MLPFWVTPLPALPAPVPTAGLVSSLVRFKQTGTAESTISDLLALAETQSKAAEYDKAIATFQNAIDQIDQATPIDIEQKGRALYGLGDAYMGNRAYSEALPVFENAIALFTDPGHTRQTNLAGLARANILVALTAELGQAHEYLSHFGTALEYYQQALTPETVDLMDPHTRVHLLTRQGIVETEIGQYAKAETTLQQAATLSQALESTLQTADAIAALAWTHEQQSNLGPAIAAYQRALTHYQQARDTSGETLTLSNLGAVHLKQNNPAAAETVLNQARALLNTNDDPYQRAVLFDSFGTLYQNQGNVEQAWKSYRQAITLSHQSNDKVNKISSLLNLGQLMESQAQPSTAIFFYKQAIANIETIRQDLQPLSTAIQKRYTLTVEDFYRHLADLLLQQDRTEEALQILELLKIQEVQAYLHSSPANSRPTNSNQNSTPASETNSTLLSPTELTLANVLDSQSLDRSLADFTALPEVAALAQPNTEKPTATDSPFQTDTIKEIQATLKTQPANTAAIYPLILEDRLEIVLITADQDPIHISQPVTNTTLASTVHTLQNKLKTNALLPTAEAQQLYDWLIRPLEETLTQQAIQNIIYLPDGILRYIPIAALHDGQQWFAQKYPSHNITAASIGDLSRTNTATPSILAGAFTDAIPAHTVTVGNQNYRYEGLPAARIEINNLLELIPNTTALFDQDFSPSKTLGAVDTHEIVHLATHAKFLPGQPESSFVLFGDGSTVNMRDIGEWQLPGVDLVVFSACQTAVSTEGDGKELLGLGFQVQQTGAGAAIASLWAVDDTSTAALMNQFYTELSQGKTKAEALQQAQIKLIENERFQHPYDWAAFILIGNGL
ncbi:MAG: CHAT domain-containing protein [Cyanobacteria bacterium J06598_1]